MSGGDRQGDDAHGEIEKGCCKGIVDDLCAVIVGEGKAARLEHHEVKDVCREPHDAQDRCKLGTA